jgi:hypothetical protein
MTVRSTIAPYPVSKSPGGQVPHTSAIFTYDYLLGRLNSKKGYLCQTDCLDSPPKKPVYEDIRPN